MRLCWNASISSRLTTYSRSQMWRMFGMLKTIKRDYSTSQAGCSTNLQPFACNSVRLSMWSEFDNLKRAGAAGGIDVLNISAVCVCSRVKVFRKFSTGGLPTPQLRQHFPKRITLNLELRQSKLEGMTLFSECWGRCASLSTKATVLQASSCEIREVQAKHGLVLRQMRNAAQNIFRLASDIFHVRTKADS